MRVQLPQWLLLTLLLGSTSGIAFSQQLAFTSRAYIQSPVVLSSIQSSREFGFDSVMLQNDSGRTITAVRFLITLHIAAGDEIADERRVTTDLQSQESKRVVIGMGHIQGLKQQIKSRKQESGLVILTIESVEFADGSEWKRNEKNDGVPYDPIEPAPQRK